MDTNHPPYTHPPPTTHLTTPPLTFQVILCTKDSNSKAREASYQLLLTMSSSIGSLSTFVQMVTAGLAAKTPHMRSAAVHALSRLLFEYVESIR